MAISVNIDEASIIKRIKVHLSIIGKRLNQKPGDKNYQNITLTTNEDNLIEDYFKGAVAYLAGQFPEVLVSYRSDGPISFDDASRASNAQMNALDDIYSSYILSYCIASYLSMINADLAKKYQQEAASYLTAARNVIYSKTVPASNGGSYLTSSFTIK